LYNFTHSNNNLISVTFSVATNFLLCNKNVESNTGNIGENNTGKNNTGNIMFMTSTQILTQ